MISYMVWFGCCFGFFMGFYGGDHTCTIYIQRCVQKNMIQVIICMVSLWSQLSFWMFGFAYIGSKVAQRLVSLICDHVCYVRYDMVIFLSLSFVGCGELGRVLETCYKSCSSKLLVYVLWMSLILHGFTSLRCCDWIVYRFDIIFCSGRFLVYMQQEFLLRLVITTYILDMLMM